MPLSFEPPGCSRARDRMDAWIDGDLDRGAAEEIRHHVDGCPSCRAELEVAEEVRAALRSLPSFDAPSWVVEAVRTNTVGEAAPRMAAGWWKRPAVRPVAAAAIAFAALLLLVIFPGRRMPSPQPSVAEVERVTAETRLALAYLNETARRAEVRVKTRVVDDRVVAVTMDGIAGSLKWARGSSDAEPKHVEDEGSL